MGALRRRATVGVVRPGHKGLRRCAVVLALLFHPAASAAQGALFPGGFEIGYVLGRVIRPDTSGWGNGLFVRVVFEPAGKRFSVGLEAHGWRQRIPGREAVDDAAFAQRGDLVAQVRYHWLRPGDCARTRTCGVEFTLAPLVGVGYGVRDAAGGPVGAAGAEFDLRIGKGWVRTYGLRVAWVWYLQALKAPTGLRPFWLLSVGAAFRFSERR